MGILSIAWYVGLKIVSENVLRRRHRRASAWRSPSTTRLTGIACPVYYRRHLHGFKKIVMRRGRRRLIGVGGR